MRTGTFKMLVNSRIITVLLLVTAMQAAPVVAKDPPELKNLIKIYERQKRSLQITAINRHIGKLEQLEATLSKADYKEDAALVSSVIAEKNRQLEQLVRIAAKASRPTTNATKTKGSTVYLKATQAKLHGGLRNSFRNIRNWKSPGCSAHWSINGIIPGRYHIQITYIPVFGGGGEIQVRELDQLVNAKIPGATQEKRFKRSMRIGTFNLRQSINLEIKPRTSNPKGVFLLTEVQLIPAR